MNASDNTRAAVRLQIEYEIKAQAQLLRAIADGTAYAAGTNPLVLLSSCENIRTVAAEIQSLAQRLRNFTK